jgi:hypothetical protein
MAHVGTQDILPGDALVHHRREEDRVPLARMKAQPVAEVYDMRPGEVIETSAMRQARQMRDEWRRERYARLKQG